jgi:hypothetical protein
MCPTCPRAAGRARRPRRGASWCRTCAGGVCAEAAGFPSSTKSAPAARASRSWSTARAGRRPPYRFRNSARFSPASRQAGRSFFHSLTEARAAGSSNGSVRESPPLPARTMTASCGPAAALRRCRGRPVPQRGLRTASEDGPGRHRLKACNLAAIWHTYRAAVARRLVMTGLVRLRARSGRTHKLDHVLSAASMFSWFGPGPGPAGAPLRRPRPGLRRRVWPGCWRRARWRSSG